MPFSSRVFVGAVAIATAASRTLAQSPDTTVLRPVVVTATRVAVDSRSAPALVTVLRGEELRARGVATVADALATVAGLTTLRSGSFGGTTSVFARGGESDHVKVLVDGVPVNNPGGGFDFASLTTDNLDRIEVVRGPTSVVYGSDAVAGVIQLFTRRGDGPLRAFVEARGGSFGTVEGATGLDGAARGVAYSLAVSARETDGIYAFNNDFTNRVGASRLSFTPRFGTVDLTARRTDATYHFPTNGAGSVVDSNSYRRDRRTTLGLDVARPLGGAFELRVLGMLSRLDGGSSNQPDSPGDTTGFYGSDDTRTERRGADARVDYRRSDGATLSLGASVEREQIRQTSESRVASFPSSTTRARQHRTTDAVYAQLMGRAAKRVTYTASGRVDDAATYGTFVTGRGSIAIRVASSTSVRAAVGNAFKAPAFDEAFSSAFTIGNPDLDPERTTSWEASLQQQLTKRVELTATYFDQRFRDLIQYIDGDASTDFRGTFANLGAALARGVELEVRASRIGAVDVGAGITSLSTRVTDAGNGAFGTFVDGERLLRRPGRSASLDAAYRLGNAVRLAGVVRYVGERDDRDFDRGERLTLGAYTLLDVSAEVSLGELARGLAPVTLTARVENATDRQYQTTFGFGAPGRTVLVGARARIGGR